MVSFLQLNPFQLLLAHSLTNHQIPYHFLFLEILLVFMKEISSKQNKTSNLSPINIHRKKFTFNKNEIIDITNRNNRAIITKKFMSPNKKKINQFHCIKKKVILKILIKKYYKTNRNIWILFRSWGLFSKRSLNSSTCLFIWRLFNIIITFFYKMPSF